MIKHKKKKHYKISFTAIIFSNSSTGCMVDASSHVEL